MQGLGFSVLGLAVRKAWKLNLGSKKSAPGTPPFKHVQPQNPKQS